MAQTNLDSTLLIDVRWVACNVRDAEGGTSTGTGTGGEVLLLDCSRVASFARKGRI